MPPDEDARTPAEKAPDVVELREKLQKEYREGFANPKPKSPPPDSPPPSTPES